MSAAVVVATVLSAQAQTVSFDFSDDSDYNQNFRRTYLSSGSSNNFIFSDSEKSLVGSAGGVGSAVIVYDSIPDSTPTNLFSDVTAAFDFSSVNSNISVGFYFGGSGRTSTDQVLALFSLNYPVDGKVSSNDQIRFFTGGALSTGAAGTLSGAPSVLTSGGFTTGTTYRATLNVDYQTDTSALISLTVSDPTSTLSFTDSQMISGLSASSEIGIRTYLGNSGSIVVDNISITTVAIPEPSTYALLSGIMACSLATARRYWRRREG